MAGAAASAAAAATTSSPFPLPPLPPGNPRVSTSSLPSSFPPRARRTNHLRKKILKTLENKPYPDPSNPQFPQQTHTVSTEETLHKHPVAESDNTSPSQGFVDNILGTFSTKSFTKIGLYLVGAFIFQTICAVLIFGSKDLGDKDDSFSLNNDDVRKSKPKSSLLSSGNRSSVEGGIGSGDGFEMDNRIMKIQEMARRAREQEKVEGKGKGLVEEEADDVDYNSFDKTVKKKEIDDRLTKLRRSLEGDYQKPPVKFPTKEGGGVGNGVDDDLLMFRKKYKYKSPSVDSGDKPKGFGGVKDVHVGNGSVMSGMTVDDGTLQTNKKNDEAKEQEPRATKAESKAGTSKEPKYDKQTSKTKKSGNSSNLESKKPQGFGKESSDTAMATKQDDFNKNDSSKAKKGGNKKSFRNFVDKSSTQTDFWWTRLPYVMAVHMQKGGNGEDSSGLFILRNFGLHHTVTFEDRSDATNFCYLLESFFEDLPNFSTSIIPIPTNELEDLIKSQKMKAVVVKKGQLKLYVGQPLEDVELALRALVEQQGE